MKCRYGCVTAEGRARPNMTSSLEKPKMNPSLRSISTTSTASPNSVDNLVVSSRPPNPAPRTTTRTAAVYLPAANRTEEELSDGLVINLGYAPDAGFRHNGHPAG